MADLVYLPATEAIGLFRSGELAPVELMAAVVERAQISEPAINAFTDRYFEDALDQAREAGDRYTRGEARPLEGLPVAIIEALAMGRPVITMRVGGIPELVEDGVTGALVEPGDTAALAVAVLRVLAERDQMGAAARAAATRFGAEAYTQRVESLLLEVLEHERAGERRRGLHDGAAASDIPSSPAD